MVEAAIGHEAPLSTIAFRTLGCKVNRAESEEIAAGLAGLGVKLVSEEEADLVVINTCTVTAEADRKARKAIRRALRMPGPPTVVVTGCLAVADAKGIEALGDRVIVEPSKGCLKDRLGALLGVEATESGPIPAALREGEGFRTRVALKVQDGCDAFCAYCVVPFVRGLPRSIPMDEVMAQAKGLAEADVAEVVLTGINLGKYESDTFGLPELLEAVAATGVRRLRVSSIEPLDLTDRLLDALAATEPLCRHLHVPLQSGSDRVLAGMGRGYTAAGFAERLDAAREMLPGVAITTDVMVGFPGETESDALATAEAVERLGFARLHVFRYSHREATRAAKMSGRVDPRVSSNRAARLRLIDANLRKAYMASRLGQMAEVLVEKVWTEERETWAEGTTEDYLTLRFAGTACAPGDVVAASLSSLGSGLVLGRTVFAGMNGPA